MYKIIFLLTQIWTKLTNRKSDHNIIILHFEHIKQGYKQRFRLIRFPRFKTESVPFKKKKEIHITKPNFQILFTKVSKQSNKQTS